MFDEAVVKRFWSKVDIRGDNECWEWKGGKNNGGYGSFRLIVNGRKYSSSHQASFVLKNGEIPENKNICHICDNRLCVNPNHLFLGTQSDNLLDMYKKKRRIIKPEDSSKCKLTKKDISEIRNMYASGKYTPKNLAEIYNVTKRNIHYIINKETWGHI